MDHYEARIGERTLNRYLIAEDADDAYDKAWELMFKSFRSRLWWWVTDGWITREPSSGFVMPEVG